MASFMQIPEECLLIILARVDLQSLCHVSATCQYMRTLIKVSASTIMHVCIFENAAGCYAVRIIVQPCIFHLTHDIDTRGFYRQGDADMPCYLCMPNTSTA